MADSSQQSTADQDFGMKLVYWLTVAMVIIGLINMTPGIPGYDDLAASLTGVQGLTFRKFPFEWFYPTFFALMMLIVALKHSMWRMLSQARGLGTCLALPPPVSEASETKVCCVSESP